MHHKLGSLNNVNVLSHSFVVKVKVLANVVPCKECPGEIFSMALLVSGALSLILSVCGPADKSITPVSAFSFT